MGKVTTLQASFTAGRISPRLYGRVDLAKYQTGLAECRNMVLMPHGGVTRRTGTIFVRETKTSSKKARLVPFEFSTSQAYMLEFGDLYMRVYKDNGIVLDGGSPYEIATAYAEAHLAKLKWTQNADTLFLVCPGHPPRALTRTGHTAWSLASLLLIDGPYLDENTDQAKTITPSGTGQYVKNGTFDTSISDWTNKSGAGSAIAWDSGSYMILNSNGTTAAHAQQQVTLPTAGVEYTLEFEVKSGPVTLRIGTTDGGQEIKADTIFETGEQTLKITPGVTGIYLGFLHSSLAARSIDNVRISRQESITLTANWNLFDAGHVGAFIRLRHGAYVGYCRVDSVTNATSATATVLEPLASSAATFTWREGAWSTFQGFPSCTTFHQQRLCFGSTAKSPQATWASKTNKYTDFTPGVDADDPLNLVMASNQVNAVCWMVSTKSLVVGTSGSEWRIGAADSESPLAPATGSAKEETAYGSESDVQPVKVAGVTLFVQRGARKVRELVYDYQSNGWVAPDLTLLSEDITKGGIVAMAYAQNPDSIVWMVRGDGKLLGLTYNRSEQVVGWHWHDTDGEVESLAVIPSGENDQVWMIVKRTVGGQTKRYVERMAEPFVDQAREDAVFLDSALIYSGAATTSFSGLDHLEGKTVHILADGSVRSPKTVTGGAVSIDKAATKATIGLPFTSEIQTLRIEGGGDDGTAQGKTKRISRVIARLHRSLGYSIGLRQDDTYAPPHRTTATPLGQAPALFSGDEDVRPNAGYETEGQVWIRQEQPYPLTVLAVMTTVQTNT
ncbi:MAG: hypothetical protein FD177_218 [Desulfovibrionaceae bacterium]|nr:MAG: hypothetical protein FD177_218 [Desulfovibrionaceae bacterium]